MRVAFHELYYRASRRCCESALPFEAYAAVMGHQHSSSRHTRHMLLQRSPDTKIELTQRRQPTRQPQERYFKRESRSILHTPRLIYGEMSCLPLSTDCASAPGVGYAL